MPYTLYPIARPPAPSTEMLRGGARPCTPPHLYVCNQQKTASEEKKGRHPPSFHTVGSCSPRGPAAGIRRHTPPPPPSLPARSPPLSLSLSSVLLVPLPSLLDAPSAARRGGGTLRVRPTTAPSYAPMLIWGGTATGRGGRGRAAGARSSRDARASGAHGGAESGGGSGGGALNPPPAAH